MWVRCGGNAREAIWGQQAQNRGTLWAFCLVMSSDFAFGLRRHVSCFAFPASLCQGLLMLKPLSLPLSL